MAKRYDPKSPVYDYLRGSNDDVRSSNAQSLPARSEALPPATANTPELTDFVAYIEKGDVGTLARVLVSGRLEKLQERRDMVNHIRALIRLPEKAVDPAKQIADVTAQLTLLYEKVTAMIQAKNTLGNVLIEHHTKTSQLELEQLKAQTAIAVQQKLLAQAQTDLQQLANPTATDPDAQRRTQELAERTHKLNLARLDHQLAGEEKGTRTLQAEEKTALRSKFNHAAEVLEKLAKDLPPSSSTRKKIVRAIEALHVFDSIAVLKKELGGDLDELKPIFDDCGIRLD